MKAFTNKVAEVKVVISPSSKGYADARARYEAETGTSNTYTFNEVWESILTEYKTTLVLENVSMKEAEAFAEPIRIAFPDQHVSIYGNDNSFIGNVTWNDQLKMFWGYPTYTKVGKAIMAKRTADQAALGVQPSWE